MKNIKNSKEPDIILASKSQTRQKICDFAGINYSVLPSGLNEALLKQQFIGKHPQLAQFLANKKADFIGKQYPESYVIGGDSVMICGDKIIQKSKNMEQAKRLLQQLRGKTQMLYSAVSVHHQGNKVYEYCDHAQLEMFDFSDNFLDNYLSQTGKNILHSVGCAMIEAEGIRLFKQIQGDYWVIMGLPLLPLLNFLRTKQIIAC
ncbi:MAG: Maf family protein [Alphaproteobacteria bacterium]|nr:Maf family protein [Alphaproteobacteria bacterium]